MDKLFLSSRSFALTHPDTLAANRQGKSTPEQQQMLKKALDLRRGSQYSGVIIFFFLAIVFFAIMIGSLTQFDLGSFQEVTYVLISTGLCLVVGILLAIWFLIWRSRQEKYQEIREGRVMSEEGTVTWGSGEIISMKSYVAKTPTYKLIAPAYTLQLPPGRYRFYFLPKTRFLLSAEPLDSGHRLTPSISMVSSTPTQQAFFQTLAKTHNFTSEDLKTNRRGSLSFRQWLRSAISAFAYEGSGILIGLLGLYMAFNTEEPNVIGGVIAGFLALFLLLFGVRIMFDVLMPRSVSSVEGKLFVSYRSAGRSANVYYLVNDQELELPTSLVMRQAASSIIEGKRYRVFYLSRSSRFLSLEPLDNG